MILTLIMRCFDEQKDILFVFENDPRIKIYMCEKHHNDSSEEIRFGCDKYIFFSILKIESSLRTFQ